MKMIRISGYIYEPIENEKQIRKEAEEFVNYWGEKTLKDYKKYGCRFIRKGWREKKISPSQTKYIYEFIVTNNSNVSKKEIISQSYVIIEVK